jgi:hypothetical protein
MKKYDSQPLAARSLGDAEIGHSVSLNQKTAFKAVELQISFVGSDKEIKLTRRHENAIRTVSIP